MAKPAGLSPLPGRLEDARREIYRDHILGAAEYEFSRAGFSTAKVSDIARRAGVSLSTVYKNFGGKEDLWDALNAARMAEFTEAVLAHTQSVTSPLEKILVGARAEVEFFAERDSFLRLHLKDGLSWGTASTLPDAGRGSQRTAWQTGMDMITRAADAALEAGEIKGLRPSIVAALVISALQVWLTEWIANDRDRPASVVADEVVNHLRRCLTAPPPLKTVD